MRKPKSNNLRKMPQTPVSISTTVNQPGLLKSNVERLVDRGYTMGYSLVNVAHGWQAIDASAIEVFVNVDIHILTRKKLFNIPFSSSFLFTCIKERKSDYELAWVNSLS